MRNHKSVVVLALVGCFCMTAGAQTRDSFAVEAVDFAKGLTAEFMPIEPTRTFLANDTVHLSVYLTGSNFIGYLEARFFAWDQEISRAGVQLSGLSRGRDTRSIYAGFSLRPGRPMPVGDFYRADIYLKGQYLSSYSYSVVPPADAIPAVLHEVTLALGRDEEYRPIDPRTSFSRQQAVYVTGRADTGIDTWVQVQWIVDGMVQDEATRSITFNENVKDNRFVFYYQPSGGWPVGTHQVELTMNGAVVYRSDFEIR